MEEHGKRGLRVGVRALHNAAAHNRTLSAYYAKLGFRTAAVNTEEEIALGVGANKLVKRYTEKVGNSDQIFKVGRSDTSLPV